MISNFDILVAGDLTPHLRLSGKQPAYPGQAEQRIDSLLLTLGSSAAVFACGAARLGLKVAFTGRCGADCFGRFVLDELAQRGVDVSGLEIDPLLQTSLRVVLNFPVNGDHEKRNFLAHDGAGHALHVDRISQAQLVQARHLHIAGGCLESARQAELADLFRRAHGLGLTTSLNTGWKSVSAWQPSDELLNLLDVYLPEEQEALKLTGLPSIEAATRALSKKCKQVIVKSGKLAALAQVGEQVTRVDSLPVPGVDGIGEGASFDAGFMYGVLKNWSLEESLGLAVACGALSTRSAGGTRAQPNLDEAMQYIRSVG